ncbi:HPr family phosphocarrier protein [Bacillus sp. HMF5848]|uniref:HPr family phosphocarrier protein n=1 Tax=Bacillus sp. HMF5848 TaxID=2495421 RepID=UPI000F7A03F9|nr:HPr family phosphocarrier protein [Bacillus sp. HMF5848]RSK27733.1 HPr family phosphocarrier protein [Bacillus sp. HMF5848]
MELTVLKPIFAEAASQLVHNASQFSGNVLIKKEQWVVDGKSLLGVLALSLQPEQKIEITYDGHEENFYDTLLALELFKK